MFQGSAREPYYLPTSLEGQAAALCLRGEGDGGGELISALEAMRRKLTLSGLPIEDRAAAVGHFAAVVAGLGHRGRA